MAKHDVTFTIPERKLGKADVSFQVKRDGRVLGNLKISNGSVEWVQKDYQYGYTLPWDKFDSLMQSNGQKRK